MVYVYAMVCACVKVIYSTCACIKLQLIEITGLNICMLAYARMKCAFAIHDQIQFFFLRSTSSPGPSFLYLFLNCLILILICMHMYAHMYMHVHMLIIA
jgi:hypothetical protein